MQKVIIIGCPGSGKSTFSKALHDATGLPLYHLDMMYWNVDGMKVPKCTYKAFTLGGGAKFISIYRPLCYNTKNGSYINLLKMG